MAGQDATTISPHAQDTCHALADRQRTVNWVCCCYEPTAVAAQPPTQHNRHTDAQQGAAPGCIRQSPPRHKTSAPRSEIGPRRLHSRATERQTNSQPNVIHKETTVQAVGGFKVVATKSRSFCPFLVILRPLQDTRLHIVRKRCGLSGSGGSASAGGGAGGLAAPHRGYWAGAGGGGRAHPSSIFATTPIDSRLWRIERISPPDAFWKCSVRVPRFLFPP
jgi:hypothetical protein